VNGDRIGRILAELKIKDPALGDLISASKSSVGRWRKGKQVPGGESFYWLCALFGHSPAYFLGHDGAIREIGEAFEKVLAIAPERPTLPGREARADLSGLNERKARLAELRRRVSSSDPARRRSGPRLTRAEKPASDEG
jgi:transcriptional regulator with XRE-family HTH domain